MEGAFDDKTNVRWLMMNMIHFTLSQPNLPFFLNYKRKTDKTHVAIDKKAPFQIHLFPLFTASSAGEESHASGRRQHHSTRYSTH
jgi:hypothetical protein